MSKLKSKGFTLIELLIVIVIIAILATLIFVSYTTIQKRARDTDRKSDLQAVAGALERFYSDHSVFPSSVNGEIAYNSDCTVIAVLSGEPWGTGKIECDPGSGAVSYIRQLPADPTDSTNNYCYVSTNQRYELYAKLEGNGNISPTSCNGVSGYNYRITSND